MPRGSEKTEERDKEYGWYLNGAWQLYRYPIGTSTVLGSRIGISLVPQRWLAAASVSHRYLNGVAVVSLSHRYFNGAWQMHRYLIGTPKVVGSCIGITSVPQWWLAAVSVSHRYLNGG